MININIMKRSRILILLLPAIIAIASCRPEHESVLIPRPAEITYKRGYLQTPDQWKLSFSTSKDIADALTSYLEATPLDCARTAEKAENDYIHFEISQDSSIPESDEGYVLEVKNSGVTIKSRGDAGLFYGLQTFLQLDAQNGGTVPVQKITDAPRFEYRGLHLDVSRHFFDKEFVKKQMAMMSHLKLNRLHLHLTDGAGWRLEIDKYPELTEKAAWRVGKTWKEWRDAGSEYCPENDPRAEGGYYSKDDIREIVALAGQLHIEVIPEIEFPGHSDEVLAIYPELSCKGEPYVTGDFCIGSEKTFEFIENVLLEVMDLFPSRYIHIGGDEASKDMWKDCPRCQALMKKEGLKSVDELQSYAIARIGKFLNDHGREMIGWDEILDGGLAPGATVMSWRGEEGGRRAAAEGHDVIMTPAEYCYLNRYQDCPSEQPLAMGGIVMLEKVYSYDPAPEGMQGRELVKGVQGNLWTEYIPTGNHAEYMLYPRLFAIAEVGWSDVEGRDYEDFRNRAVWLGNEIRKVGYNTFGLENEIGEKPESLRPSEHLAVGCPVTYVNKWHENYPAAGEKSLTDGIRGSWSYGDRWQGFLCTDMDVTIDLGEVREIHEVTADFIQWRSVEIWVPEKVEISLSEDGKNYRTVSEIEHFVDVEEERPLYMTYSWNGNTNARYIRYKAYINRDVMGWLFTDEIEVL